LLKQLELQVELAFETTSVPLVNRFMRIVLAMVVIETSTAPIVHYSRFKLVASQGLFRTGLNGTAGATCKLRSCAR